MNAMCGVGSYLLSYMAYIPLQRNTLFLNMVNHIYTEDCMSESSCSAGHIVYVMGFSKGLPHYFYDVTITASL